MSVKTKVLHRADGFFEGLGQFEIIVLFKNVILNKIIC